MLPKKLAFSIPDLVAAANISRSMLYEEIKSGKLRVRKVGRRTIVLYEDAESWLRSLPELYVRKSRG